MVIVDGMNTFERALKRLFDVVFSFLGIIVLSPVFLIVYIVLLIQNEGSVIFKQERIGYKGKAFNIYKFRRKEEKLMKHEIVIEDVTPIEEIPNEIKE